MRFEVRTAPRALDHGHMRLLLRLLRILSSQLFHKVYKTLDFKTLMPNSIDLSTTREAIGCAPIAQVPSPSWQSKVHYSIHKGYPLDPILSVTYSAHTNTNYPFMILSTHLSLGLPSGLSSSVFTNIHKYTFQLPPFVLHAPHISSSSFSNYSF
jgi:hypothetical protein